MLPFKIEKLGISLSGLPKQEATTWEVLKTKAKKKKAATWAKPYIEGNKWEGCSWPKVDKIAYNKEKMRSSVLTSLLLEQLTDFGVFNSKSSFTNFVFNEESGLKD